jgi:hypothetical protein
MNVKVDLPLLKMLSELHLITMCLVRLALTLRVPDMTLYCLQSPNSCYSTLRCGKLSYIFPIVSCRARTEDMGL